MSRLMCTRQRHTTLPTYFYLYNFPRSKFINRNIYIVQDYGLYSTVSCTYNMKVLNQQYAIDMAFLEKPWKKLTYSEISKISKKRSKWYVYDALNRLVEQKILLKPEKIGRSLLHSLNLGSAYTQSYMGFLEEYRAWTSHIPLQIIENLRAKMPTVFFIMLVTGSYAKKKQTKTSDLDVVIICDDAQTKKSIYAELQQEADLSLPPVHLYVFTKAEFLEMLTLQKENYGKEFVQHHLIFTGGAEYFSILKEAIDRGFKG